MSDRYHLTTAGRDGASRLIYEVRDTLTGTTVYSTVSRDAAEIHLAGLTTRAARDAVETATIARAGSLTFPDGAVAGTTEFTFTCGAAIGALGIPAGDATAFPVAWPPATAPARFNPPASMLVWDWEIGEYAMPAAPADEERTVWQIDRAADAMAAERFGRPAGRSLGAGTACSFYHGRLMPADGWHAERGIRARAAVRAATSKHRNGHQLIYPRPGALFGERAGSMFYNPIATWPTMVEIGARGFFPGADDDAVLAALAWDVPGYFCGAWGVERDDRDAHADGRDNWGRYASIGGETAELLLTVPGAGVETVPDGPAKIRPVGSLGAGQACSALYPPANLIIGHRAVRDDNAAAAARLSSAHGMRRAFWVGGEPLPMILAGVGAGPETGARGYFPPAVDILRLGDRSGHAVDPGHAMAYVKRERASRRHGLRPGDGPGLAVADHNGSQGIGGRLARDVMASPAGWHRPEVGAYPTGIPPMSGGSPWASPGVRLARGRLPVPRLQRAV
jgi:hypothetical protein